MPVLGGVALGAVRSKELMVKRMVFILTFFSFGAIISAVLSTQDYIMTL